jgi:Flp pilus assembly protein TadG
MSAAFISRISRRLGRWVTHERRRRLSEAGFAAIMVALVVPTIGIACAAVAVDTGTWYVEMQMTQKAADAAALAGVPYLPQDLASAKTRALQVAARNGYNNNQTTNWVTVALGEKATQLQVTIKSVIVNTFGSAIGVKTETITRSGTADYQGPAPMGSPCNTFGNEPNAGNRGVVIPVGTAQSATPPAGCTRQPQLWATVNGPENDKGNGDRYQTLTCSAGTGTDGCDSSKNNLDYDDFGYVFVVKVDDAAKGTPINLQLYDPLYVNTGGTCDLLPDSTDFPVNTTAAQNTVVNTWVTNKDAVNRYTDDGAYNGDKFLNYCSGDNNPASSKTAMTTSFVLRQQTDTQNPEVAPVQNDTSGSPCIKQYGTYNASGGAISSNTFKSGASGYDAEVAQAFHNWVSLCTFTPARAGNYYLQVRSNVTMGGTGGTLIKTGNTNATAVSGNTTSGAGQNMFAMRAVTNSGKENSVAVSGYNHMPIYVNADTATPQFHLIRVLPGAAGQKISFSYFDLGDASGTGGYVQVQKPTDATGSITSIPFPGGCTAYGGSAGGSQTSQTTYSDCKAPFTKTGGTSNNNSKIETITIPIPSDYTCNYLDYAGCWYHVQISFNTGGVSDITTWDATILGDPVRLIK